MKLTVYYMSGAGNTFSVIDNREAKIGLDKANNLAPALCSINGQNRHKTEGLMLIDKTAGNKDFKVEFFNPDGSHGAMCGNGGRCAVMLAEKLGIITPDKDEYFFVMAGKDYSASFAGSNIRLYLPPPAKVLQNISIPFEGYVYPAGYVDVNTDHVVINIKSIKEILPEGIEDTDLVALSLPVRNHRMFEPKGVNVNLYEVLGKSTIRLRTYERGVEAETGACGTGSVSTAIISYMNGEVSLPVKIIPPSRIPVWVDLVWEGGEIAACILEGPAEIFDTAELEV